MKAHTRSLTTTREAMKARAIPITIDGDARVPELGAAAGGISMPGVWTWPSSAAAAEAMTRTAAQATNIDTAIPDEFILQYLPLVVRKNVGVFISSGFAKVYIYIYIYRERERESLA